MGQIDSAGPNSDAQAAGPLSPNVLRKRSGRRGSPCGSGHLHGAISWRNWFGRGVSLCLLLSLSLLLGGCSGTFERHLEKGKSFLEGGKNEEARIELLNALKKKADDPEATLLLAKVYLQLRDGGRSLALYQRVHEADPANREASLALGRLLVSAGRPQEGENALRQGLALNGDDWEMWAALARALLARRDLGGAEAALARVEGIKADTEEVPLIRAGIFFAREDPEGALALLRNLVESHPDRPEFRQKLAEGYEVAGKIPEAIAIYQVILAEKDDSILRNHLGTLLARTGDQAGAVAEWEKAAAADPRAADPRLNLARWHLGKKELDKALARVEEALKAQPGDPPALAFRGELALLQGRFSQASSDLQAALKEIPRATGLKILLAQAQAGAGEAQAARTTLQEALAEDPANVRGRVLLARLLARQGQLDESNAQALAASRDPVLGREALLLSGDNLLRKGNPKDAEEAYRRAGELFGHDAEGQLRLARSLAAQKRTQEAVGILQASLRENPQHLLIRSSLTGLLLNQGRREEALETARGAGDSPEGRFLLATALERAGLLADAEKVLLDLVEARPDYLPAYGRYTQTLVASKRAGEADVWLAQQLKGAGKEKPQLWILRGMTQDSNGDRKGAMESYRQALKLRPDFVPALNNLAWDLMETGDLKEALKVASSAREKAPKDSLVLDTYGWILFKMGDPAGAKLVLEQALDGMPDHPVIKKHLEEVSR